MLNITAVDTAGSGVVTVWPCDETKPLASNLNYTGAGQIRPNQDLVISKLTADGTVCVVTEVAPADIIVTSPATSRPPDR